MKEVMAELRATGLVYGGLALIAWAIYHTLKKDAATVLPSAEQVGLSLKQIVKGAPGAFVDVMSGNDETGYITWAQAQAQAKAALDAKRAIAAQAVAS